MQLKQYSERNLWYQLHIIEGEILIINELSMQFKKCEKESYRLETIQQKSVRT